MDAGPPPGATGPPTGAPPFRVPAPPVPFVGPILLGALFAYLLYGVLLTMTAQYYQITERREPWGLRILVPVVLITQTLQVAFLADNAWTICVLGFLNPMNIVIPAPRAQAMSLLNGIISLFVQFFFAWRIYSLANKIRGGLVAALIVAALSLTQFAGVLAISFKFMATKGWHGKVISMDVVKVPIAIHLASTAACDTVITIAMIYVLSVYRENTSFARTKTLLNTLIMSTIENGLITTVTAIANLIVFFVRKRDMIHFAFQYVIGGLYAIVFITSLNRRQTHKITGGSQSISLSEGTNPSSGSRGRSIPMFASEGGTVPSYQVSVLTTADTRTTGTVTDGVYTRGDSDLGIKSQHDGVMVSVTREEKPETFPMSYLSGKAY